MANNNTPVKTDKKAEIKKDNQKAEAKTDAKAEKAADDEEIDSEELFKRRHGLFARQSKPVFPFCNRRSADEQLLGKLGLRQPALLAKSL